jgi:hypothetical protein
MVRFKLGAEGQDVPTHECGSISLNNSGSTVPPSGRRVQKDRPEDWGQENRTFASSPNAWIGKSSCPWFSCLVIFLFRFFSVLTRFPLNRRGREERRGFEIINTSLRVIRG